MRSSITPETLAAFLVELAGDHGASDAFAWAVNQATRDVPGRIVLHRVRTWQETYPTCAACKDGLTVEPRYFIDGAPICERCLSDGADDGPLARLWRELDAALDLEHGTA